MMVKSSKGKDLDGRNFAFVEAKALRQRGVNFKGIDEMNFGMDLNATYLNQTSLGDGKQMVYRASLPSLTRSSPLKLGLGHRSFFHLGKTLLTLDFTLHWKVLSLVVEKTLGLGYNSQVVDGNMLPVSSNMFLDVADPSYDFHACHLKQVQVIATANDLYCWMIFGGWKEDGLLVL
ncbi:hypothetical protein RHSIM_Rhsim13G0204400 [Rhododendron simsii]|uniref:Uncharacterized protein n=1 Tax=Rhododendron simsii TaxID=118357 RepID=A0A834L7J2_RHOSS|nr:hypothetical protein RHSIM_Rhsim13G0204400 [Rhododendron simsii]